MIECCTQSYVIAISTDTVANIDLLGETNVPNVTREKNTNLRFRNSFCFLPKFCSFVVGATSRALILEMGMNMTRIMTMMFLEMVMQLMEISVMKNTLFGIMPLFCFA